MRFGIALFPTDQAITITELATAVEERGYDSLWVAEHTHIPVDHTPHPSGGPLDVWYKRTLDPFVALTAAATVTTRLLVGTGICLVVQHDPIDVAKQTASLDHLSGGRLLFGIGGGWNRTEMADHGTAYETRWSLMRERVEAIRRIWTEEEAEYHGRFVDFGPMWAWPKPVQRPHPPVLIGGNGPRTLQRVIRYGDGWMPNGRGYLERVPELQRLAEEAGRGPIPISGYPSDTEPATIESHRAAGVERCIFYVPATGRDDALRKLDQLTEALRPDQA